MKGICIDGPAQGWTCDRLPKPAPKTLLVPEDIEEYMPGTVPQGIQPGTEFPGTPDSYGYRLDRVAVIDHATLPGAPEAAAVYVYDQALQDPDGHMPSLEDWNYSATPVGLRS